jgi:spoIIIJ-associated protein
MASNNEVEKYKATIEEFLQKMSFKDTFVEVEKGVKNVKDIGEIEVINVSLQTKEPQILIGQNGQTLFEIQRLLKIILNKKYQNHYYLELDINYYKSKKVDYLKKVARDSADEVVSRKEKKSLVPMTSHERRIVHAALSERGDVTTESQSDGADRYIVISPK